MSERVTVTTPHDYIEACMNGQPVSIAPDSDLRGRILRGRTDDDFLNLAPDDRKLVLAMGPEGLAMLPGADARMGLECIGMPPAKVETRIAQGYRYKLLAFAGVEAPLATWDAVLDQVAWLYPVLRPDVAAHRATFRTTPREAFIRALPPDIEAIDTDPTHPAYVSLKEYCKLQPVDRLTNPLLFRRLLLHEVHLNTQFTGTGDTLRSDGSRGMPEYVAPNGPIAALPVSAMIDLVL